MTKRVDNSDIPESAGNLLHQPKFLSLIIIADLSTLVWYLAW